MTYALPIRILLATDGSEDAALAAVDLAARSGAELHVVVGSFLANWIG